MSRGVNIANAGAYPPRVKSPFRSISRDGDRGRYEGQVEPLSPFHRIEQMVDRERNKLNRWQRVRQNIDQLMTASMHREELKRKKEDERERKLAKEKK